MSRNVFRPAILGVLGAALVVLVVVAGVVMTRGPEGAAAAPAVGDAQLTTAADSRVFFGHQSVGGNIVAAVPDLYTGRDLPVPAVVASREPVDEAAFLQHAAIGTNGDPLGKIADFETVVRGGVGDTVDVALMKLCYVDVRADTDLGALFTRYRETLAGLARDYPDVAFVHATVPLTVERDLVGRLKGVLGRDDGRGAEHNVAREAYNAMLRAEYGGTGRLFDLAAVESTRPDGSRVTGTSDGVTWYALHGGYAADPGHLNAPGGALAAGALLDLVADAVGGG